MTPGSYRSTGPLPRVLGFNQNKINVPNLKFFGFCSVFCSMGQFTIMSSLKDVSRCNQYLSTSFNLIKHLTHLLYISVRDPEEKLDGSQESQRLYFPLFFEEKEGETKKKTL